MKLGVGVCPSEVDRTFRSSETIVVVAIEQFSLGMHEVDKWCAVRFGVIQRQNIKIDIGDPTVSIGHFVTQDAFGLQPVESWRFTHHHEQVVGRGVAVGCAAD